MRQRIMLAAAAEMRVRSIKFTMADLARHLRVSKRFIYDHFESKNDIISAIIDTSLQRCHEQRTEILNNKEIPFHDKLMRIFIPQENLLPIEGLIADDIKRYMPAEWAKFEQYLDEEWGWIEDFFKAGIEAGYLRPICLPVIKKMIDGSRKEIIDYRFLVQHNISLAQIFTYMADIFINGMLTRDG